MLFPQKTEVLIKNINIDSLCDSEESIVVNWDLQVKIEDGSFSLIPIFKSYNFTTFAYWEDGEDKHITFNEFKTYVKYESNSDNGTFGITSININRKSKIIEIFFGSL